MLVLSGAEVRALLDLDELVEVLRAAMIDVSAAGTAAGRTDGSQLTVYKSVGVAAQDAAAAALVLAAARRQGVGTVVSL